MHISTIAVLGMRLRDHHEHYNRRSPGLPELWRWQETQLEHWAHQGVTFYIGCADHWDAHAMKWLFYNGFDRQIRLLLPFPGFGKEQGEDWSRVRRLLESRGQADYLYPSPPEDTFQAMNLRNQELIKRADAVLWLWDGVQTDSYDKLVLRKPRIVFPWEAYTRAFGSQTVGR